MQILVNKYMQMVQAFGVSCALPQIQAELTGTILVQTGFRCGSVSRVDKENDKLKVQ